MITWIPDYNGNVPSQAVAGGTDSSGEPNYIGQAQDDSTGEVIPGKIVPSHGVIYYASGDEEHYLTEYQCLVHPLPNTADQFNWISTVEFKNNEFPRNAVVGGRTAGGEKLYIGRAYYKGGWVIGKIQNAQQQQNRTLLIPYGGRQVEIEHYDVLVLEKRDKERKNSLLRRMQSFG